MMVFNLRSPSDHYAKLCKLRNLKESIWESDKNNQQRLFGNCFVKVDGEL